MPKTGTIPYQGRASLLDQPQCRGMRCLSVGGSIAVCWNACCRLVVRQAVTASRSALLGRLCSYTFILALFSDECFDLSKVGRHNEHRGQEVLGRLRARPPSLRLIERLVVGILDIPVEPLDGVSSR